MDPVLNDGLLIFGFLAIVLAPMALALANRGPAVQVGSSSRFFAVPSLRGPFVSPQVCSSRLWRGS
jgi:hypothetical protein